MDDFEVKIIQRYYSELMGLFKKMRRDIEKDVLKKEVNKIFVLIQKKGIDYAKKEYKEYLK
jgi:hypothetical protein